MSCEAPQHGRLAHGSQQDRSARLSRNLISEMSSHHVCRSLWFRNQSLAPAHARGGEGLHGGSSARRWASRGKGRGGREGVQAEGGGEGGGGDRHGSVPGPPRPEPLPRCPVPGPALPLLPWLRAPFPLGLSLKPHCFPPVFGGPEQNGGDQALPLWMPVFFPGPPCVLPERSPRALLALASRFLARLTSPAHPCIPKQVYRSVCTWPDVSRTHPCWRTPLSSLPASLFVGNGFTTVSAFIRIYRSQFPFYAV